MDSVKPRIRLLAIDIDGTLLNSKFQLPDENIAALRHAHEAGLEVALVTGRRHSFALPIARLLGFDLWLISSNGAVTRSTKGDLFHRDLLPVAAARALCAHMDAFRGNMVVTFDREEKGALVLESMDELGNSIRRWLEQNLQYIEFVRPIEKVLVSSDPIQAMFCGTIARMHEAEARLRSATVLSQITLLKTQYTARDLCILDVLNRDCSKGHALKRWAEFREILPPEVMAIGDNYNDIEMLEFAGCPFIMENACDELKQNGWNLTLSNDQCGVAAAIEQVLN